MSRTLRRNNKHLIRRYCGLPEHIDDYDRRRYGGNTVEETYIRRVRRFTRDRHRGHWTAPSKHINLYFNRPHRRAEKSKLHRHLMRDDWDNHLPENRARGGKWSWFWF